MSIVYEVVNYYIEFARGTGPQGAQGPPGADADEVDMLAYLQSLPTSVPSTLNMPYWDEEVLLRSVAGTGGDSFWDDSETWDDTEIWADGGAVGAGSGRIYSIGVNEPGDNEQLVRRIVFPAGTLDVSGTVATIANLGGGNLTGHVTSVGTATVLGSFTKAQLDTAVSDGNVLYVGDVTTNATHGGDVYADGDNLVLDKPAIAGKPLVVPQGVDHLLVGDETDRNGVLKKCTVQSIIDLPHNHAATEITSGTLPVARLSFTKAELDTAVSDGNVLYVGDVTSNATHTGDVTGDTALTIANSAVTLAKMANLAQDQFIGRTTASTGVPETATITAAARTVLDDATVADMVNTLGGATSTGTGALVRAASPTLTGTLNAAAITASQTTTTVGLNVNLASGGFIDINRTSQVGVRESILRARVSDAGNDAFHIYNGTIVDNRFVPAFSGSNFTGGIGLIFAGQTDSANDTGTSPLVLFEARRTSSTTDPNNGTLSAITTRPLFVWQNFGAEYMRMFANGNLAIGSTTDNAAKLQVTGNLTASGTVAIGKQASFTEQVYTPTGTTQTIDLNDGNLNTLTLGSTTGNVTLTLTVPTSAASGRIKIIQHGTTARGITISLSSLTAKWFSVIPTWTSQAVGKHTILSYTRDGSFMNFSAVEEV